MGFKKSHQNTTAVFDFSFQRFRMANSTVLTILTRYLPTFRGSNVMGQLTDKPKPGQEGTSLLVVP